MKLKSAKQLCKDLEFSAEFKKNEGINNLIESIEQGNGTFTVCENVSNFVSVYGNWEFTQKTETVEKKFLFFKYKVETRVPAIKVKIVKSKVLTFSACCKNETK